MNKLFYLLAASATISFASCQSAIEPKEDVAKNQTKTENTTPKTSQEEDGAEGIIAKGENTYITLGLKDSETLRKLGQTVRLEIGTRSYKDQEGVWIDLNGNGVRDENENIEKFQQPAGGQTQQEYRVKTPLLRIYGKVNYVNCSANNSFISAEIKNNPELQIFWADNNKISSIDLSNSPELDFLYLRHNKLNNIDVSKLPKLRELDVAENNISELNVNNNPELVNLHCDSTKIKTIDLSRLPNLEYFTCALNPNIKFDVTKNSKLRILFAARCELNSLNVTENSRLQDLEVSGNNFKQLDVTKNAELKALDITNCKEIQAIDLTKNANLETLWIYGTNLKGVEFSNNPKLKYLIMENANLSTEELNTIFNSLPTVENGKMDYRGNEGTKSADFSIAQAKGWITTLAEHK